MKIKKFCATATLLAAACAMQAGAMAADTPTAAATAGTATQSTVGTAVTATNQTANTDAATGELLPSDVQTSSDGLQLKKIYDVDKTTSPDKIPQADFERGGFKYTFEDLLKIELPEMDRKVHSETVTVSSSSNNTNDVLSLLPKSKSVSTTDGYTGTAYLDISSISTKVAGTESVSNDLSATREYPGLSEMDMESIPKSITENGHTLRFADVEWKEANDEADNFGTVQTTYTAVVSYTGTATSSRTTGYTVTATYAGEVSRRNNEGVRYIAVYSGTPIEEIPAIPEEEQGHEEDPPDLTGLIDPEQEQQNSRNDEHKAPLISWVLCAIFGILMLLFAFRPPMCRRMMQQMQQGAQAVREKINNETERIKSERQAKVYDGETIANMRLGAAHFEGTSGWDGNVAMCGHNRGSYGYFGNIHTLKNGDTISYTTIFGTRTYKVYSVRKIAKTDTSVLDPSDANIITLITCVRDVPSQRWCVQAMAI